MDELLLMRRIQNNSKTFGSLFTQKECQSDLEKLTKIVNSSNYCYAVVYLLILNEEVLEISKDQLEIFSQCFEKFKKCVKSVADSEWHSLINSLNFISGTAEKPNEVQIDKELKSLKSETEVFKNFLIDLVMETLMRTGTAEIERSIEVYLENEMKDPRTRIQKNAEPEMLDEILENFSKLSEKEQKNKIKIIAKLLKVEHVPAILNYAVKMPKILLGGLYMHNKTVYNALQNVFLGSYEPGETIEYSILEHFPEIEIDKILVFLKGNTPSFFKVLDRIIKMRPIHQEKIVNFVVQFIKTGGSRVKAINFIRENIKSFNLQKIQEIGLGCEEILQIAEKDEKLLGYVFEILTGLKSELKEKRVLNLQKKEKRLATLISTLATELCNLPNIKIQNFIEASHEKEPDLLAKVCISLFRLKQPSPEIVKVLTSLILSSDKNTSTSFVFTALPYLEEHNRYFLMSEYLTDDVSLTLFLRMIRPEEIFTYVHTLKTEVAENIMELCWNRSEVFTDRVTSSAIEEIVKTSGNNLPEIFSHTVRRLLKKYANIKPFIANLIKREWVRIFSKNKNQIIQILEGLGMIAVDVLLSGSDQEVAEIIEQSQKLKVKVQEYLKKQPKYIQEKYKNIINLTDISKNL